ncbi:hypothetical protein ACFOHS_11910 [Jhaorihella thermophila]
MMKRTFTFAAIGAAFMFTGHSTQAAPATGVSALAIQAADFGKLLDHGSLVTEVTMRSFSGRVDDSTVSGDDASDDSGRGRGARARAGRR